MKKVLVYILIGTMALSMSACGKTVKKENKYGKVELGNYKGLEIEKNVHEINEEDIQKEIEGLLDQGMEEVDKEIAEGYSVDIYYTAKEGQEVIEECTDEAIFITVGNEELGEEFDKKIIGAKKNDHLTFTIKYDDEYGDDSLRGKTVDYDVTIDAVYEDNIAELTPEFIKDTLGYESEESMKTQLKQELQETYDDTAVSDMQTELLQNIVDSSKVIEYSQEEYKIFEEMVYEEYDDQKEAFGYDTVEEVYESMGMTEEDIENEILNYLYERLVVEQIAIDEGIEISEEEYKEYLEESAESAEYTDVDEFEKDMGKDNLYFWALEEKVMDKIMESTKIKEIDGPTYAQQQGYEWIEE